MLITEATSLYFQKELSILDYIEFNCLFSKAVYKRENLRFNLTIKGGFLKISILKQALIQRWSVLSKSHLLNLAGILTLKGLVKIYQAVFYSRSLCGKKNTSSYLQHKR